LDPIVQKFIGRILTQDEPGVDGFPKGSVDRLLCFSMNHGERGDVGDVAQAGQVFQVFWVMSDKRLSFPATVCQQRKVLLGARNALSATQSSS